MPSVYLGRRLGDLVYRELECLRLIWNPFRAPVASKRAGLRLSLGVTRA